MADSTALPTLLKALRLPTMAQQWEALQSEALQAGWSFSDYLAVLCEQELAERESKRLARHLKQSMLPSGKTLPHFDFQACPQLNPATVGQLAGDVGWLERAENLLIFGPSGVGKTHLAAAIGHGLIDQGKRVYFTPTTVLVQQLQTAKRELRLPEALAKLDKYHLLILDDIGYVKKSEGETSVLFELIAHRYETGSLLVTSNHPFSQWEAIFADEMMTVAAIDRVVHHATIIEIQAESYRKRTSMQRRATMT